VWPITVAPGGVEVAPDSLASLQQTFATQHVVRLQRFLAPSLLSRVQKEVSDSIFELREDAGIARELCLQSGRAMQLLTFVMNAPLLLDAVRAITQQDSVALFSGRIYRFDPRVAHHDSWHDDTAAGGRLAGFSLNLGDSFEGGEFEIRDKSMASPSITIANTGPGDAILFRVAPTHEHRVRSVRGLQPKTAMAGWFVSGSTYWDQVLPR
jgi:hypothetical protein